jgi:hypothetical protein
MNDVLLSRRQLLQWGSASLPSVALAACGGGGSAIGEAPGRQSPYLSIQLPGPISQHGAVAIGASRVALLGGSRNAGVLSSSVNVLDANSGAWTEALQMTTGRADMRVLALSPTLLFVHGGARSLTGARAAEWADLTTGLSTPAVASHLRQHHTVTQLLDGRILVAGGLSTEGYAGNVSPSLEIWDPATRSWRYAMRPLQQARQAHTATLMPDGSVVFVGGYTASGMAASAEKFDPATEVISFFASPLLGRAGHSAALQQDGRILLAGGEQGLQAAPSSPSAIRLGTVPWQVEAVDGSPDELPTQAAGVPIGNQLILLGGLDRQGRATSAAWSLGATSRTLTAMPQPRSWHSVTPLSAGGFVVVGGEADGTLLATALRLQAVV